MSETYFSAEEVFGRSYDKDNKAIHLNIVGVSLPGEFDGKTTGNDALSQSFNDDTHSINVVLDGNAKGTSGSSGVDGTFYGTSGSSGINGSSGYSPYGTTRPFVGVSQDVQTTTGQLNGFRISDFDYNGEITTIDTIIVNYLDNVGEDIHNWILNWKGFIKIEQNNLSTLFGIYSINTLTDQPSQTQVKFEVSWVAGGSGHTIQEFTDCLATSFGVGGTAGTSGISNGTSGSSGKDGSGTAGTSGKDGNSGSSGTSGGIGNSGSSGTSGDDGSSGTSGKGIDGSSGTSGVVGPSGSSGSSGFGSPGDSGSNGSSGSSGNNGTSGTSGDDGSSGTSGINGLNGTSGSSGKDGLPAAPGTSGTSGSAGSSGDSGLYSTGLTFTNDVLSTPNLNIMSIGTLGQSSTILTISNGLVYQITGFTGGTGSSGTSGSGISGSSGTSGGVGATGTSGTSGNNGSSGSSGKDATGTSGTSGSGSPGTSGTSGNSGYIDPLFYYDSGTTTLYSKNIYTSGVTLNGYSAGYVKTSVGGKLYIDVIGGSGGTGSSGTSGSGISGSSGTSGSVGATGTSGSSGINGSSGKDGLPGTSGTNGSVGLNGTSGESGTIYTGLTYSNMILNSEYIQPTINYLSVDSSTGLTKTYTFSGTMDGTSGNITLVFKNGILTGFSR